MCCARVDAGNAHIRSSTMPASHNTKLCKRKRRQTETETLISKFGSNSLSFSRSLSPLLTTAFIARTRSNSRETRANEFKLERMILPEKKHKMPLHNSCEEEKRKPKELSRERSCIFHLRTREPSSFQFLCFNINNFTSKINYMGG